MRESNLLNLVKENWSGILLAVLTGLSGYAIHSALKHPVSDPLVTAIILGIIVRTIIGDKKKLGGGFILATKAFIPIGIIFYAIKNLNFLEAAKIESRIIAVLISVMLVYFGVIFFAGSLLRQKKKITYLTATGSAICGASAIAITSPAVEAEADDISISLIAVTIVTAIGSFFMLPFLAILSGITQKTYLFLAGSTIQLTGFVKIAVENTPFMDMAIPAKEASSLALSIKAGKYLGLLLIIPLFSSFVRKKFYIPWFLWAFLSAGILGTLIYKTNEYYYTRTLIPAIKPVYDVSWSIAMGAIGLNADIKQLLSNNGAKAIIMAFAGFIASVVAFFIGFYIVSY